MPKLTVEYLMIGIADFQKSEYIEMVVVNQPKFNRMWGVDYILMDSSTFMGGINGSKYEEIIDFFVNIRASNENQLFAEQLS